MLSIIYLKLFINLAFPQSMVEDCNHFYNGKPIITTSPIEVDNLISLTKVPLELLQPKKDIIDFGMLKKLASKSFDQKTVSRITELQNYLEKITHLSEEEKIIKVNQYINSQFLYTDDLSIWGKIDYWATPLEMFGKLAGDCEDFAILKYLSLLQIGIDPSKLKISYVKIHNKYSQLKDEAHMVLKYFPDNKADPKILDSIVKDIYPSSKRLDLKPFYDFNHSHVFVNNDPATYTIEKISKWKECIEKMKTEGINL